MFESYRLVLKVLKERNGNNQKISLLFTIKFLVQVKKYNFQLNSKRNLFASSNFFRSATLYKAPPSGTVLHIQVKMLCLLF